MNSAKTQHYHSLELPAWLTFRKMASRTMKMVTITRGGSVQNEMRYEFLRCSTRVLHSKNMGKGDRISHHMYKVSHDQRGKGIE